MIRVARISDLPAITAMVQVETERLYPKLRFDAQRTRIVATDLISSAQHYCKVVEQDGRILGCLAIGVSDNLWAERKHGQIMVWKSELPGMGVKLMRDALEWVDGRRAIKYVGFMADAEIDARVEVLLERLGFQHSGWALTRWN